MVSERIKERVAEVEDKYDFDELMNSFKMSNAPLEVRQEAMEYLKAQHSQFDDKSHTPTKEVLQMIKDGEADTDDIGNGY